ncbi:hypothetical protein [Atrimonas thermophila]|uniref:hypothetical protein n=1 Tax=Atrimonas thermophila TaxID=3064161 RepID=UPI00399C897D
MKDPKEEFLVQSLVGISASHFLGVEVHDDRKIQPPIFPGDRGDIETAIESGLSAWNPWCTGLGAFLKA